MSPRTTRSPSTLTSGWPRRSAPVRRSSATPACWARAFEIETGAYDRERHAPIGTGDTGSPFDELGLGTPDFGVDFSAPARGLAVWAILREIGADGVRERIVRHNDCARRVADRVRGVPIRWSCSPSRC